jgi:hypothetical protein
MGILVLIVCRKFLMNTHRSITALLEKGARIHLLKPPLLFNFRKPLLEFEMAKLFSSRTFLLR